MKKQVWRLALFICLSTGIFVSSAAAQATCASAAGNWTDIFTYGWQVTQDAALNIAGAVDVTDPPCATWTVSGTFQGAGSFFARADNPTGGDAVCAAWFRYDGTINKPGCNTGNGTWVNSAGLSGNWSWSKACDVPTGETTASHLWDDGGVHRWTQTLTPANINFGGRTVMEQDPGGGGPDTCWFDGSMFAKFEAITGGTWDVDTSNVWGDDFVGWFGAAVTYYRNQGRAPCGTSFPQRMVIDCSTGNTTYIDSNQLGGNFDATTVTSTRAGQTVTRTWP